MVVLSCKGPKEAAPQKHPPKDDFRITFHEAIQEKMRGNYDVAAELFEKCLSYNDNSDAVHYALSDVYEYLKKQDKSLEHALRAFELDQENKWYQLRLGDMYYTQGNYHKSSEYYALAIADEKNLDIKFKYAESLIFSHNYKKAIEVLNEIEVETGISPHISLTKHDMYLELGDTESAERELYLLIADNPKSIENRLAVADYFLRTNQPQKAEKIANEALVFAPESGEVRLILADIAIRKGDLDKCFEHLKIGFKYDDVSLSRKLGLIGNLQRYAFEQTEDGKKIQLGLEDLYQLIYDVEAKNDTLHSQYGNFLLLQNKPVEAVVQFQKVVDINPDSFDNWLQLLYLRMDIADFEGMLVNAKAAIELYPSQPVIFLLAGMSAYEMADYSSSEEWLYYGKELVVNDPPLASEFEHQLGCLSWKQKDYAQAKTYFDSAKSTDPYNGNVFYSQAMCYLDEGKNDQAQKEAESALEKAPTSSYFLDLKGMVQFKIGNFEKAKKAFENALVYEQYNPIILEHYGDVLYQLGDTTAAMKQWQLARDYGGYNPVLLKKMTDKKYYAQ